MKTLSIFIICITLGLFYSLALDQQNKRNIKNQKTLDQEKKIHSMMHESYMVPYLHRDEDFSMQVTGKEHRYLNTGISFIENNLETESKHVMVAQTDDKQLGFSGS